jgi:serine/threonine-protein kinase
MPNQLIRALQYVRPGTHSTKATTGPNNAPPYAAVMRLKKSFDLSRLSLGAQVVAKALQTYGMVLADGGRITFTAANDEFTQHKWIDVGFNSTSLQALRWSDFEMIDTGEPMRWVSNCERDPVTR